MNLKRIHQLQRLINRGLDLPIRRRAEIVIREQEEAKPEPIMTTADFLRIRERAA